MEDLKKAILVRDGKAVGALGDKNFSTAPIGTVLSFAGQTAPHGYLLCDGASYKVADYPHLYAVIGNTYGGDTENFNVPNLVDKFIQGSTTSGTEKEAGIPNITGIAGVLRRATGAFYRNDDDVVIRVQGSTTGNEVAMSNSNINDFDASKGETKTDGTLKTEDEAHVYGNSDTVQPPALTMVYIIKAFHTNEGVDSGVSDDVVEYVDNKIASELKTSSNTDVTKTPDLKDTTYFDYGNDTVHNYVVRNGICYFTILLLEKTHTTSFVTIMEGLPGALMQTYFSFPPYYSASGDNTSLQVNFSSDGVVAVSMGAKDNTYMLTGSYPIA